ncbi:MAG: zf-HC2 domain-containing protein [Bacillota bacterium]|nr:zf-HC2 domain-containing protein [Bacillota bacterium]
MNCHKVQKLISAYVDRELRPEEEQRVRQHLRQCEACSREEEQELAVKGLLESLPELELPVDFWVRLDARLAEEAHAKRRIGAGLPWTSSFLGSTLRLGLVSVAMAAVLVAVAFPFLGQRLVPHRRESLDLAPLIVQHEFGSALQPLADTTLSTYRLVSFTQEAEGEVWGAEAVNLRAPLPAHPRIPYSW